MRRVALLLLWLAVALPACADKREPLAFPSEAQGRLLTPTPSAGPEIDVTTFSPDGCPAGVPRMCQEAATAADALVQSNTNALFTLSRPTSIACANADTDVFRQCEHHQDETLDGYLIGGAEPDTFVNDEKHYRRFLGFMKDGLDPTYSDEYGTGDYAILGLATCAENERYQLVYTAGLGDPTSTLPADRFFGTLEFTEQDHGWSISTLRLGLLSDWQLAYDDPTVDAGCGEIHPWGS
jgi:hypothetical protein